VIKKRGDAYESKAVSIGMILDIFRQVTTRHPIRNELDGSDNDTQER